MGLLPQVMRRMRRESSLIAHFIELVSDKLVEAQNRNYNISWELGPSLASKQLSLEDYLSGFSVNLLDVIFVPIHSSNRQAQCL